LEISRREFMKLLGFSAAGATLGVWGASSVLSVPDEVFQRALAGPGIETWKNSICSLCGAGCGIRVRRIDGIPVRVIGNPLYPINRYGICPRAEAAVELLFHPDRLKQPLKRTGARGRGMWQPISWDEALGMVVGRLRELRRRGNPEQLVAVMRDVNTAMTDLLERFLTAYGSPNLLFTNDGQINTVASALTHGWQQPVAYDFFNTNFVLNFGGDFLDDGPSPVRFNQIYAHLRNRKNGARARIVHIDSCMSRTAIQSSEWVPIQPGTMAALALGIAHVMIKDQSFDREFVHRQTFGFRDWQDADGTWHQGFRSLVDESYYPEKVASLTGVPARRIVELARDFAAAEPALAIAGGQAATSTNGLYTLWAVYCLNALKGNFDKEGGLLFPMALPQAELPPVPLDAIARRGLRQPRITDGDGALSTTFPSAQRLPDAVLAQKPYPVDTLLIACGDPLFESADQKTFAEALRKVPFIVACTPFLNDTAAFADLILPDHVFLEKWDASRGVPTVEFQHFGVQQPVIEPLYDTRQTGDVLLQISQQLGGKVAEALPWQDTKAYLQALARRIFDSGEGTIVSETAEVSWIEFLKKRGWQPFDYATFEEFWEVLLDKGGWWDPRYRPVKKRQLFNTPSRKFEFYSQRLKAELDKLTRSKSGRNLLQRWRVDARGDVLYLPHFEPPRFAESGVRFPYHLVGFRLFASPECGGANLALLQEMAGMHPRLYWQPWVEINPETASHLGIRDGDWVNIISIKGEIQLRARVLPTVMPEVVRVPFGFGQKRPSHAGLAVVPNPLEIFATDVDALSGIPSLISTKVRIEKATRVAS
jgi:anaerobic selenocysteine-containing dehydrogenase